MTTVLYVSFLVEYTAFVNHIYSVHHMCAADPPTNDHKLFLLPLVYKNNWILVVVNVDKKIVYVCVTAHVSIVQQICRLALQYLVKHFVQFNVKQPDDWFEFKVVVFDEVQQGSKYDSAVYVVLVR